MRPEHGAARLQRLPISLWALTLAAFAFAFTAGCHRDAATPSRDAGLGAARDPGDAGASIGAAAPTTNDADAATPNASKTGTEQDPEAKNDDGNDDPEDVGHGKLPEHARFEKVGTPPLALTRICDLTPLGGALYLAHANQPLGTDGATITRYRPTSDPKRSPFSVAFDWNRPGEPTKGGGAGQGFLRAHAIGGKLFVADADPPYGGLGLVDHGTEGYVFVSDPNGSFAPPRAPNFRPPAAPDLVLGRAGAGVLPRAYHVIDVVRYRGSLFASTGSVPPTERAWRGASPGALHRANESGSRWTYEVDYPFPWKEGVWRLTYLVRFHDRLYAGIQDYDGREPNDYVVFSPPADAPAIRHEDAHPMRITRHGATQTLRWWVDTAVSPHRLYWVAWTREGVRIFVTTNGDTWAPIAMPDDAGRPADITRFRNAVVVLTENGLYRLTGTAIDARAQIDTQSGVADAEASLIASATEPKKKSPFEVSDVFCTAPLAVFENRLYAGGQRGGTLYRLAEDAEP